MSIQQAARMIVENQRKRMERGLLALSNISKTLFGKIKSVEFAASYRYITFTTSRQPCSCMWSGRLRTSLDANRIMTHAQTPGHLACILIPLEP